MIEPDDAVCVAGLDAGRASGLRGGGRRRRDRAPSPTGRYVASAPVAEGERAFEVAVDATLRAAAARGGLPVLPADLRRKVRLRARTDLVVFVVDHSDSTSAERRLAAAKGAVLGLLSAVYLRRDRVAVVAFAGERAAVLLPPTPSVTRAREALRALPVGGATPFAAGLLAAWQLVRAARLKDPAISPLLVVLSDGEANVPLGERCRSLVGELCELGARIRADRVPAVLIDTRPGYVRSTEMRRLAAAMGAPCHPLRRADAAGVLDAILSRRSR